jgi:hypothetical protein
MRGIDSRYKTSEFSSNHGSDLAMTNSRKYTNTYPMLAPNMPMAIDIKARRNPSSLNDALIL